jgi:hypothetical protein
MMDRSLMCALLAAALTLAGGCGSRRTTNTPRTGVEQLLVAAAVEQAVSQLDFAFLEDRRVYVDDSLVDRADKTFVVAEVRAAARESGVRVVDEREKATYVMELRAGAVGTDQTEYILGLPASTVPSVAGSVPVPEAALFKSIKQMGACHVAFVAYSQEDGRLFYSSGPAYGFSDHRSRWVFGAGPSVADNIAPPQSEENTAAARGEPVSPLEQSEEPRDDGQ